MTQYRKQYPCRGCGDDIIFIELESGKKHPCQPEPIMSGDLEIGQSMITSYGEVLKIRDNTEPDIEGWLSHFALCPEASQFRKSRKPKDNNNENQKP